MIRANLRIDLRESGHRSTTRHLLTMILRSVCLSYDLSGMFRRIAILHRKSFAAIPSLSLVLLAHTNRSVKLSHLNVKLASFRHFWHFQDQFLPYQQGEATEEKRAVFRKACVFWRFAGHRTIRIAAESRDTMPLSIQPLAERTFPY